MLSKLVALKSRRFQRLLPVFALIFFAGCAAIAKQHYDQLYGPEQVRERRIDTVTAVPEYHRDVKSIVDSRCVVCHGCYDAPCQLKMSSFEAIDRGAHKDKVYDGARLVSANLTRMFEDADTTDEWRQMGFYPVLNERAQISEANLKSSTLFRMLDLKRKHPLPTEPVLPASFDFSLNRKQQCVKSENFDQFESKYPLWGMPYGLPALNDREHDTVVRWLQGGAKVKPPAALSPLLQREVAKWEGYLNVDGLNADSLKRRLVSRYIYEHLFIANIYFPDVTRWSDQRQFFKVVRSTTPSGQPVQRISSRRPFDDPGVEQFYYRLVPVINTIVVKNHMPYRLDAARMQRWDELFYQSPYEVSEWPGYDPVVSANPFDAFEQLPVTARYKFMLDEAKYTISGFIKGPVCRGQTALNVINDRFWVVFSAPDSEHMSDTAEFISQEKDYLRMPAEDGSDGLPIMRWRKFSALQKEYSAARNKRISELFPNNEGRTLDLIWDGDGHNPNAALTIIRHFDSATVVQGHIGDTPKTAWIIGYTLLERIHYLLVAGYDVYGNVGHQLLTRLYMDFLRMEGEDNLLHLLPPAAAKREMAHWYRGAESSVSDYIQSMRQRDNASIGIDYQTDDPKTELLALIQQRMTAAVLAPDPINRPAVEAEKGSSLALLQRLAATEGRALIAVPEQSLLRIQREDGSYRLFTLLRDLSHSNVSSLFGESRRLIPEEHRLTVVEEILGAYPNVFFDIQESELAAFVDQLQSLSGEDSYRQLLDNYALRRSNPKFWAFSDWLHEHHRQQKPVRHGLLDYNRLENR